MQTTAASSTADPKPLGRKSIAAKSLAADSPITNRWLQSGGWLAFSLHSAAMKEDKAQRKQAEDQGVFFWFGDDGAAMKAKLHRASTIGRKTGSCVGQPRLIVESEDSIRGSRLKLAERLGQNARSAPSRSVVVFIAKRSSADPNAKIIPVKVAGGSPIHKQVRDGSVSVGVVAGLEGDGWSCGGCEVGQDIGHVPAVAGRDGVLVGNGRKGEVLVVGFGAGIEVSAIVIHFPSVAAMPIGVAARRVADGVKCSGGACAGENPESLVGVVTALVNVDVQLRLALLQRRQGKQNRCYEGAKSQRLTACGGGGGG